MNSQQIRELFDDALERLQKGGTDAAIALSVETANEAARLTRAAGEPGFAETVRRSAGLVFLRAVGRAVEQADAADAEILGLIRGVLFTLAKVGAAA